MKDLIVITGTLFAFVVCLSLPIVMARPVPKPHAYYIEGVASSGGPTVNDLRIAGSGLADDAKRLEKGAYIPLLINHSPDTGSLVGRVTALAVEGDIVRFRAEIPNTPQNADTIARIARHGLHCVSMGFDIEEAEPSFEGKPHMRATDITLVELSIVVLGADEGAIITKFGPVQGQNVNGGDNE